MKKAKNRKPNYDQSSGPRPRKERYRDRKGNGILNNIKGKVDPDMLDDLDDLDYGLDDN